MARLTLNIEAGVVARAKQYARQRGVSVSELVQAYLAAVVGHRSPAIGDTPILRSVRGVLSRADADEYRKHLAAKYR